MKEIYQKLAKLERYLSNECGTFTLFGLFQESDSSGNWDVVISARWIQLSTRDAIRFFVDKIAARLNKREMQMLRGVFVLPPDEPFVRQVVERYPTTDLDEPRELSNVELRGRHMSAAYIITAQDESASTRSITYLVDTNATSDASATTIPAGQ